MANSIFDTILVEPASKVKLRPNWQENTIEGLDRKKFTGEIMDGIPVILPLDVTKELKSSELHHNTKSEFNYIDHYQKDAEVFDYFREYDSAVSRNEIKRLHQYIVHHIPKTAGLILDVGCGNGWLNKIMVNNEKKVISMDISVTNPRKAIKNNPRENHFALVADVFNLPLADGSVDCIVASEIIEHVADPALFIEKLLQPLKKGGKLIITTPYNEKLQYHLCVHCNKPTPANAHIHSFNENNIEKLIPKDVTGWKYKIFINKILVKLRVYLLIGFFPYFIWKFIDKIANGILKSQSRLLIEIVK